MAGKKLPQVMSLWRIFVNYKHFVTGILFRVLEREELERRLLNKPEHFAHAQASK